MLPSNRKKWRITLKKGKNVKKEVHILICSEWNVKISRNIQAFPTNIKILRLC